MTLAHVVAGRNINTAAERISKGGKSHVQACAKNRISNFRHRFPDDVNHIYVQICRQHAVYDWILASRLLYRAWSILINEIRYRRECL